MGHLVIFSQKKGPCFSPAGPRDHALMQGLFLFFLLLPSNRSLNSLFMLMQRLLGWEFFVKKKGKGANFPLGTDLVKGESVPY